MTRLETLPNPEIIKTLYRKNYSQEGKADFVSSHWKDFSSRIKVNIDEAGRLTAFEGYGFGDLQYTHFTIKFLNYLCNSSYLVRLNNKQDIFDLMKKAAPQVKKMDSYLSYDCFRQICALSVIRQFLKMPQEAKFSVLIIGDGYGFLATLIKTVYPNAVITLIDIGKVLLFQAVNLQKVFPRARHRMIGHDPFEKDSTDFFYVPAEDLDQVPDIRFSLMVNIASMQEMTYPMIERYFAFLRAHAKEDNLFYCCNRIQKRLVGGELIEIAKYPWAQGDRHWVDELCPFYTYFFNRRFPIVHRFEGTFVHRLTCLQQSR